MWTSHLRRTSLALIVLGLGLLSAPLSAQDSGFIEKVTDLPLMPGLSEVKDAGVVFDKPDGRIVEAYAEGEVERKAVLGFYHDTLPQLGWTRAKASGAAATFRREGENLALDFLDGGGALVVRFTLTPEQN